MAKPHQFEVIIIGAGASGLACAHELLKQNVDLAVFEGRSRLGGRVYSLAKEPGQPAVELGAEFIHSASPVIMDLIKANKQTFYDIQMEQLFLKGNKLVEQKDFWKRFEKVIHLLDPERKKDRSMAEFIDAHKKSLTPDMRKLLIAYVEDFQAADVNIIGEKSFAKSEQNKKNLNEVDNFRLAEPYIEVLKGLLRKNKLKDKIHLQHTVKSISWSKDGAEVECLLPSGRRRSYTARHVVLTVPLGVLKSQNPQSSIKIFPHISELTDSFSNLYVGHVQRLTFIFKERFWEDLSKKPVAFLRAGPEHHYPTWWTLSPLRVPYLIAWQGGPKAQAMSAWTEEKRLQEALKTLSALTGKSLTFLRSQMISAHSHNWSLDPYSLGAYSYTGVETSRKSVDFLKPFKKFLWVTGEATAKGEAQGTVHGALEQGFATAKQILKRLK